MSGLGQEPCVRLGCKHIFHVACISKILRQRWLSPRINFAFMNCPSCKVRISADYCPEIKKLMDDAEKVENDVKDKALKRSKEEGLHKDPRLKVPGDAYYNDL